MVDEHSADNSTLETSNDTSTTTGRKPGSDPLVYADCLYCLHWQTVQEKNNRFSFPEAVFLWNVLRRGRLAYWGVHMPSGYAAVTGDPDLFRDTSRYKYCGSRKIPAPATAENEEQNYGTTVPKRMMAENENDRWIQHGERRHVVTTDALLQGDTEAHNDANTEGAVAFLLTDEQFTAVQRSSLDLSFTADDDDDPAAAAVATHDD